MIGGMETQREREFSRLTAVQMAAAAKQRKVTQQDLARAAGITPEHLSHVIAGRKGLLNVGVLLRAAERLGLDPQLIVERAYEDLVRTLGAPATPRSDSVAVPSRQDHERTRSGARGGGGTKPPGKG